MAGLRITAETASLRMMQSVSNQPAISLTEDTILDLNYNTLNMTAGAGIVASEDLTVKNGEINIQNATRGITSSNTNSTWVLNNLKFNFGIIFQFLVIKKFCDNFIEFYYGHICE